jgi:hypothetical protein|nr:MAG TPA: hypothetical protein [Caudoviricetes sp.]
MKDLGVLLSELAEIKELNKKNKEIENDLIKSTKMMLDEQGITKGEYDGIKVSYTTNTKSELDDDTLIQILLNMAQEKPEIMDCLIKTYTVDEDKLEELMYGGLISTDDIAPAYREKQYKTLRVKRVK